MVWGRGTGKKKMGKDTGAPVLRRRPKRESDFKERQGGKIHQFGGLKDCKQRG